MKRQLTDEEKKFTTKSIEKQLALIEYNEYLVKYRELMISEGLRLNYEMKLREAKEDSRIEN
jgi:hypothetical protein